MLSSKDKKILDQILETKGNCMQSTRCPECPFRSMCLPEFLNPVPPTPNQRLNMAMDVLFHNEVLDENFNVKALPENDRSKFS